jgi:hypothetical protein
MLRESVYVSSFVGCIDNSIVCDIIICGFKIFEEGMLKDAEECYRILRDQCLKLLRVTTYVSLYMGCIDNSIICDIITCGSNIFEGILRDAKE